jgi:hypothetical protein
MRSNPFPSDTKRNQEVFYSEPENGDPTSPKKEKRIEWPKLWELGMEQLNGDCHPVYWSTGYIITNNAKDPFLIKWIKENSFKLIEINRRKLVVKFIELKIYL